MVSIATHEYKHELREECEPGKSDRENRERDKH